MKTVKAKIKALCKQAAGASPEQLIEALNPVRRGWANDHRHVLGGKAFRRLDSYLWRRLSRWATPRHANKTGHGIAERYFPPRPGESWRLTDPNPGKQLIRVPEAVKAQRHLKIKGEANPFDREGDGDFQRRDQQLALQASSRCRANVLTRQHGRCPVWWQVIQGEEDLELHPRDHHHQNNRIGNLGLLHPNCHRQLHSAPDRRTESARPARGVGHA